jgi:hypothetical protein
MRPLISGEGEAVGRPRGVSVPGSAAVDRLVEQLRFLGEVVVADATDITSSYVSSPADSS